MNFDLAKLTAPLKSDEIEWKIQAVTKGQNVKTLLVPYITNRCIIHRLNHIVGIDQWKNRLIPVTMDKLHGFVSELSIKFGDEWITRQDTANLSEIEPLKGGASDAMKRCAVQFGIGIELYDYPKIFIEGEHKFIPDWAFSVLSMRIADFHAGTLNRPVYIIKESDLKSAPSAPARQPYERPQAQAPTPQQRPAATPAQPQPAPTKRQTAENMKAQQEAPETSAFVFDIIDNTKRDIDLCNDEESFDHVEQNTWEDLRLPEKERIGLIKLSIIRRAGMVTTIEAAEIVKRRIAIWTKVKVLNTADATAVLSDLVESAEANGMYYGTDRKFYYQQERQAA